MKIRSANFHLFFIFLGMIPALSVRENGIRKPLVSIISADVK